MRRCAVVVRVLECLVGWPTSLVQELDSSESVDFRQFKHTVFTHYDSVVRARVRWCPVGSPTGLSDDLGKSECVLCWAVQGTLA